MTMSPQLQWLPLPLASTMSPTCSLPMATTPSHVSMPACQQCVFFIFRFYYYLLFLYPNITQRPPASSMKKTEDSNDDGGSYSPRQESTVSLVSSHIVFSLSRSAPMHLFCLYFSPSAVTITSHSVPGANTLIQSFLSPQCRLSHEQQRHQCESVRCGGSLRKAYEIHTSRLCAVLPNTEVCTSK